MVDQNKVTKKTVDECKELACNIRKKIVSMADYSRGTMHWGGSLSCVDILAVLFGDVLNIKNKDNMQKDKFLLSKGHAALALYATMYHVGILNENELLKYQQNGEPLTELIEYNENLGFESSGGSLGINLSYAVGMSLLAKREFLDYKTYVLLGDGELDEGSVWEAIMFASHMKLDNLTIIIDENKMQSDGETKAILPWDDIMRRMESFGWDVIEVDGHDHEQLINALRSESVEQKPRAIIAHTIKGKGISFMEDDNSWHDRKISKQELILAKKEVGIFA